MNEQLIIGMGEVGSALFKLLKQKGFAVFAQDVIPGRMKAYIPGDQRDCQPFYPDLMHICFPFSKNFAENVYSYMIEYDPAETVIHSTVPPGTTDLVQKMAGKRIVIYSPVRGVHIRMLQDLKRYTKYWASRGSISLDNHFAATFAICGLKLKRMSNPLVLELAKIYVDTTYYGWLILYAQHTKEICETFKVDWQEMWEFSDEINKFLKNRPKMYPGEGIGGHCVLPNLELIDDEFLDLVFAHDKHYKRHLKVDLL